MTILTNLKKLKENQSIDFLSKSLLTILTGIFVLNCVLSYIYISNIKKQNLAQIEDTLNIFTRTLKQDLYAEERFLYWTILHDQTLDDLLSPTKHKNYIKNLQDFRAHVQEFETYNKVDFSLFIQESSTKKFINISPLHISYSEFLLVEKYFQTSLKDKNASYNSWDMVKIGGKYYLYKIVTYNEKTIYSVAPTEAILKPLKEIEIGKNGTISVTEPEKSTVFHSESFGNYETLVAKKESTQLPFNIYVNVDYNDAFRDVLLLQSSILLLPMIVTVIAFWILLYAQKRVISPMKRLLKHLRGATAEEFEFNKEGIIEIDDANDQINYLFNEIQVLKHDIFNEKLKQKSIELNRLKNQIHPHFYLNILSMIHGMVQTEHYREIEQLTLSTSQYFRYLFQTDQNFVPLKEEIQHINDYLQIQRLRYGNNFSFQLEITDEVINNAIPPLILQTFVENIFKHCFSMDSKLNIRLVVDSISEENDYYRIILEDNGPGFSEEVLAKLKKRISLITKDGKHIGLTNTYERLDNLYLQDYYLQFKNGPTGGAIIKLILPSQIQKGISYENLTR